MYKKKMMTLGGRLLADRCQATTKGGSQCNRPANKGGDRCFDHLDARDMQKRIVMWQQMIDYVNQENK